MNIISSSQMKKIEKIGAENQSITYLGLMKNAGNGAYNAIKKLLEVKNKKIVLFCGNGNNGGDGFVIANNLINDTKDITIILSKSLPKTKNAIQMFMELDDEFKLLHWEENKKEAMNAAKNADIIIDGIFGTGFHGELDQNHKEICSCINNSIAEVISIDIPTGVTCDDVTMDCNAVRACYTLTFHTYKPCHVFYPTSLACGKTVICDIGIQEKDDPDFKGIFHDINDKVAFSYLKPKSNRSHKGTNGKLLNIAGSMGLSGAAMMSCNSAKRSGCGYVRLATTKHLYEMLAPNLMETTVLPLKESPYGGIDKENIPKILSDIDKCEAVCIGCGLGFNSHTQEIVKSIILNSTKPIVLDADALNALATDINILKRAKCNIIVTPHIGEMARLIKKDTKYVLKNKVLIARKFAKKYNVTVVLKDHQTVVVTKSGQVFINRMGNCGLAKAGSGDILTGIIGSLLAQGYSTDICAICGVYIHARSADLAVKDFSKYSLQPTDLLNYIGKVFLEQGY